MQLFFKFYDLICSNSRLVSILLDANFVTIVVEIKIETIKKGQSLFKKLWPSSKRVFVTY